jgi:hypothetical protein
VSATAEQLGARRAELAGRIAGERQELAAAVGQLKRPLQTLQRIERRAESLRRHKWWLLLPAVGLALMLPARMLGLLGVGIAAWQRRRWATPHALPPPARN